MLSKEVCLKCYKRGRIDEDIIPEKELERDWQQDSVGCIYNMGTAKRVMRIYGISVDSEPPKWCPYRFEQGVASGMGDES